MIVAALFSYGWHETHKSCTSRALFVHLRIFEFGRKAAVTRNRKLVMLAGRAYQLIS